MNYSLFNMLRWLAVWLQNKVARVPGGLDLMLAAGFSLTEEAAEVFLRHPGGAQTETVQWRALHAAIERVGSCATQYSSHAF